jgi:hypothetical protein
VGVGVGMGTGIGAGCAVTITLIYTLPVFVVSKTEVAKTKRVVEVSLAEIVSSPLEFIAVPDATYPVPAALELTVHVTAFSGLLVPRTDALNCTVLPLVVDWFAGPTVTPDIEVTLICLYAECSAFEAII